MREPVERSQVVAAAAELFSHRFGGEPVSAGIAPGRVNLIGEHTDYNGGLVLPAAVPYFTAAVFRPRSDGRIRLAGSAVPGIHEASIENRREPAGPADYVAGMARELEGRAAVQTGARSAPAPGFDMAVASTLPISAGLASSAALLLSAGRAWLACHDAQMDAPALARAARRAENDFVGVPCGFMDHFISSCARTGTAMLLDCADETFDVVTGDLLGATWIAVYSGIPRNLAATENARVLRMKDALEHGAAAAAGAVLLEGHWSLSADFGVSLPEIDRFVRRAADTDGCLGLRITGAGFGGSLIALLRRGAEGQTIPALARIAAEEFPAGHAFLRVPAFCDGASAWKL